MAKKNKDGLMGAMPSPNPKDGSEQDYEANNAMDTIMKAHEHMANPDMMKRVHKHAGRKLKALKGLTDVVKAPGIKNLNDLKAARDKMANPDEEMGE